LAESEPTRPTVPIDSELPAPRPSLAAPETRKGRRTALGVAVILSVLVAAWIASPLWVGLMLGTVMAFTTQPFYRWLADRRHPPRAGGPQGASDPVAASLVTLLSAVLATVVGAVSLYILARELLVIGTILQQRMANGTPLDVLGPRAIHLLEGLHVNRTQVSDRLNDLLGQAQGQAMAAAAAVLQAMTGSMLGLLIALITEFYVLVGWPQLVLRLESLLPLDPRHTRALMIEFREVSRTALVGTIATAVIQGFLAFIGYAIAGVATPITWGVLTAISSLLPVVGTFLIWVPIAGYQMWNDRLGWGVFILIWGFLVVSIATDYYIRPRLIRKKGQGHPLLMLISLIGGIEVMGLAGLIVAPILMSLFLAVLRIYEREVAESRAAPMARANGH
jgi:predicted PurR-regulated permease PerM